MKRGWLRALMAAAVVVACLGAIASGANKPSPKAAAKSLPRLVDFGSDFCLPCKMMEPFLQELAKKYAGLLKVESINATKKPEEGKKYRVKTYPTQIFFNGAGRELYRHEGFYSKAQILAKFKSLGIKLTR